jgi:multisubunit Na+/H+ antiporter MnhB subunit
MHVGSASSCSSRSIKLFTFGCTLAVVLMTFQYEHKLRLFNSPRLMLTLPALSLISVCGLGAALIGFLYPLVVTTINQTTFLEHNDTIIRKSQVCKSVVIFVGINHLCAVS